MVSVLTTIEGGHTTATFNIGNNHIDPFYYVPWWNEGPDKDFDKVLNILRGDFFCFPFGMNVEPYGPIKYPLHGQTSNDIWDFLEISEKNGEKEMQLQMYLEKNSGNVILRLRSNCENLCHLLSTPSPAPRSFLSHPCPTSYLQST